MSGFEWPVLMRAGMVGLRLRPDQFWQLTPAELLLMLGQGEAASPMNRVRLGALMSAWPDEERGEGDE